ncbi:uncharacterized protein [Dermacentor andersoni]|uniref:uncharacterized protein n=1 Tax=Dermacentor andersoni TaxID=34620 RepID=UPI002155B4D6|nr:uncharacterized protein LOC126528593 [Dermacentor andersoni]
MAACDIGSRASRLFIALDHITGTRFLVDTGAELSIVLATAAVHQHSKSTPRLYTVNNTVVVSYGFRKVTLDIGLWRLNRWVFVIAYVTFAILGVDFLSHFNLDVSVRDRRVKDNATFLDVLGLQPTPSGIRTFRSVSTYDKILSEYPQLTKPRNNALPVKHKVTQHITTTEPPVAAQSEARWAGVGSQPP